MKKRISEIKVKKRIRRDSGDIEGLMESLKRLGLLNPIVIDENNVLLAGFRRLEAAKRLEWEEIDVHIVKSKKNKLTMIDVEIEENLNRADFTHRELEEGLKIRNELKYRASHSPFIRLLLTIWYAIVNFFASIFHRDPRP